MHLNLPNTQCRTQQPTTAAALQDAGAHPLLANLWASRGQTRLHTKLLPIGALLNAKEAGQLLAEHRQGFVRVVADYDSDGATACAILLRTLRAFGFACDYIVPSRFKHGYGLSVEIAEIASLQEPRPTLLVTVDNGISSIEGVARAKALGVQVLVTDHHSPGLALPDAECIVNPNQPSDSFASKALAGCGVAWYVAYALQDALQAQGVQPVPGFNVASLLPLVALGTVADLVPLDENNRNLVRGGLRRLRTADGAFAGIRALARVSAKLPEHLTVSDFSFSLAPRLNAAGRMDTMDAGIECLLTDSDEHADQLAKHLHEKNTERKEAQASVEADADLCLPDIETTGLRTLVLYDPAWHEGVIGIAAGKLKEKHWRPTFVLTKAEGGKLKGSGRSIPGFHLRDALALIDARHPGLLLSYGGHAMAAGLTLPAEGLALFKTAFEQAAQQTMPADALLQTNWHDGRLSPADCTLATAELLEAEVWGQAFPAPVFIGDFQVKSLKWLGAESLHARVELLQATGTSKPVTGMLFFASEQQRAALEQGSVQALYTLNINRYAGKVSLQLQLQAVWQEASAGNVLVA